MKYIKIIKVNLMHGNYGEAAVKSVKINMFMIKLICSGCLFRKFFSVVSDYMKTSTDLPREKGT